MIGTIALCFGWFMWFTIVFCLFTFELHRSRKRRRQWVERDKEDVSSVSTPPETMMRKTSTAEIAQELVNLDHALREMTFYDEVLRLRSREEPQNGHNR